MEVPVLQEIIQQAPDVLVGGAPQLLAQLQLHDVPRRPRHIQRARLDDHSRAVGGESHGAATRSGTRRGEEQGRVNVDRQDATASLRGDASSSRRVDDSAL